MNDTTFYLAQLCRVIIAITFLFSSVGKIKGFSSFIQNLAETFSVPIQLGKVTAIILIIYEVLLAGAILLGGELSYGAMAIAMVTLMVFTGFIGWHYYFKGPLKCSCFGDSSRPVSRYDFIRNLILIALAGFYLTNTEQRQTLGPQQLLLLLLISTIVTMVLIYLHEVMDTLAKK